jgi:8-hydroxy-5-deazaflavin:NADPH oxidoreductase
MFICGDDEASKNEVKEILERFGWETEDMGNVEAARAIEPLAMLVVYSRVQGKPLDPCAETA